jgi:putative ABC transport system permease protein
MKLKETVKLALKSLAYSKLRTTLSLLGIIIGVGAVVLILSLSASATNSIKSDMNLGSNNQIFVSFDNYSEAMLTNKNFMDNFYYDIKANVPGIDTIIPIPSGTAKFVVKKIEISSNLKGIESTYFGSNQVKFEEGIVFDSNQFLGLEKTAIIGSRLATKLFPSGDALGNTVEINKQDFIVGGVLAEKESGMMDDYNNTIYIPSTTFARYFSNGGAISNYLIITDSDKNSLTINSDLKAYIKKHTMPNSYQIFAPASYLKMVTKVTSQLSALLAAIAAISLVVGGIGIMNIMLVSVTERTVEIGVRKAIGAKRRDILQMFLVEAIVVTSIGGLIGLGLAEVIYYFIVTALKWKMLFSISSIAVSFGFSLLIGIFFGSYPAAKAAKLNPIDALNKV